MREYGRNVQNLVAEAVKIEDRDKRNQAVQKIIDLMGRMYPYLRDLRDFKHKLWDHLVIMSDFKLDIDAPHKLPTPETFQTPPNKLPYSNRRIRYRYYGNTIIQMIRKAEELPDGEEKNTLIGLIANHMKKSYIAWNRDNVEDEIIFRDLERLSNGKLKAPENLVLYTSREITNKLNKRKRNKKSK